MTIYNINNYSKFLLLCLIFVITVAFLPYDEASADHCNVSKIAIIGGPWTDTASDISLTVQAQDASGNSCHTKETLRLSFESSGAGEFLNQSGNPVQEWISANSANRNFFYRNQTGNNHIITVEAGYGPVGGWSPIYQAQFDTATPPVQSQTPTPSPQPGGNGGGSDSSHSGAQPLSNVNEKPPSFRVGAGRVRTVSMQTPVRFEALIEGVSQNEIADMRFVWSFGDGTSKEGRNATHHFQTEGEYIVVLNAYHNKERSTSRTTAHIFNPDIKITSIAPGENGYIEITNNSPFEINLEGWYISMTDSSFVFPQDTLIATNSSIRFPYSATSLQATFDSLIALYFPTGRRAYPQEGLALQTFAAQRAQDLLNQSLQDPVERQVSFEDETSVASATMTASARPTQPILQDEAPMPVLNSRETMSGSQFLSETVDNIAPADLTQNTDDESGIIEVRRKKSAVQTVLNAPKNALSFIFSIFRR